MTTKMSEAEVEAFMSDLEFKNAVGEVNAWFEEAESLLQRQLEEVTRYKNRFNQAVAEAPADRFSPAEEVVNWAVNQLTGFFPNLRVTMAMKSATRFALIRTKLNR